MDEKLIMPKAPDANETYDNNTDQVKKEIQPEEKSNSVKIGG